MKLTDQELRDIAVTTSAAAIKAMTRELLAARKVVEEARHVVAMGQVLHRSDVEARNRDSLVAALTDYDKAVKP